MLFYLLKYIKNFEAKYKTTIFEIGQNFPFSKITMENSEYYIKSEDIIADFINEYLHLKLTDDPDYKIYCKLDMDYISADDLYSKFVNSNYYRTLETNDKKNYSRKSFINNLKNSCFTCNYYKREITRNKIKLTGKGGYLTKVYYNFDKDSSIGTKLADYKKLELPVDSDNEEEENTNEPMVDLIEDEPSDNEYDYSSD